MSRTTLRCRCATACADAARRQSLTIGRRGGPGQDAFPTHQEFCYVIVDTNVLIDYQKVLEQFCLDVERSPYPIKIIVPSGVLGELDGYVPIAPGRRRAGTLTPRNARQAEERGGETVVRAAGDDLAVEEDQGADDGEDPGVERDVRHGRAHRGRRRAAERPHDPRLLPVFQRPGEGARRDAGLYGQVALHRVHQGR